MFLLLKQWLHGLYLRWQFRRRCFTDEYRFTTGPTKHGHEGMAVERYSFWRDEVRVRLSHNGEVTGHVHISRIEFLHWREMMIARTANESAESAVRAASVLLEREAS